MLGFHRVPHLPLPGARLARCLYNKRPHVIDNRWPNWDVVIGIEVHAQIKARKKLFSAARAHDEGEDPNTRVSAFDAAFPGTLPSLNPNCVNLAIRTALALNSDVHLHSAFDRKHYFYTDLPSGYQITQQYAPIARGGLVHLEKHGINVRLKQIQLEQDTGKSFSEPRLQQTSIDLNRAGSGLMELVSEPDMRSPEEAGEYVRTLQSILRAVGASDGNMEQGSLRCDVNVSVNRFGEALGNRCEIKNLNSVKFAQTAIIAEVRRQIALLEYGERVAQETRGFDEHRAETYTLRSKEDAPDYRYMPDPNLPPLLLTKEHIHSIRASMPALPSETRQRLLNQGLTERAADVLMMVDASREVGLDGELSTIGSALTFFDAVATGRDAKVASNWITHELMGQLAHRELTFRDSTITVTHMGEIIDLVESGKVTGSSGKTLLRHMLDHPSDKNPVQLAEDLGLFAVEQGSNDVQDWCNQAIEAMPNEAASIRAGNSRVLERVLGRVMKISKGRADARTARAILVDILQPEH